jgi:hypothetical protein
LNATTEYIKDKKTGFIYNGDVVDDLFSTIKSTEDNNLIEHISQEIFTNFDVNKFSRCCYVNNLQKIYDNLL